MINSHKISVPLIVPNSGDSPLLSSVDTRALGSLNIYAIVMLYFASYRVCTGTPSIVAIQIEVSPINYIFEAIDQSVHVEICVDTSVASPCSPAAGK
jgi:hypothetical protein